MSDHVHEELGAYVLGALSPPERQAVEVHLQDCQGCRDDLSRLSVLPGLLDRLSADEVTAGVARAHAHRDIHLERLLGIEQRRLRRAVARWRTATVAATLLALTVGSFAWAPWESPPDRLVAVVVPMSDDATTTTGTVSTYAWEWGTTVEVDVADLPPRDSYVLWAVGADGHRERAGTWGPTGHRGAFVRGACSVPRSQLVRIEVTDEAGAPLLAAQFAEGT